MICTDNAGQVCKFTCRHAELQLSVYGVQPQRNGAIEELSWHIVTQLLDKMSKSGNGVLNVLQDRKAPDTAVGKLEGIGCPSG